MNDIPIRRALELGDRAEPFLTEWIDDGADALAQAIVGTVAVIDVDAVVIDGILPAAILKRTVRAVSERFDAIVPEGVVAPRILVGTIGPRAAAIGAAVLPRHVMFAPDSAVLVKSRVSGSAMRSTDPRSYLRDQRFQRACPDRHCRRAMVPKAKWVRARSLLGFLLQRIRRSRKRLVQEWAASTTQRLALPVT